jgi:hypothetical protein
LSHLVEDSPAAAEQGSGRDVVGIMSGIISDKLIIAY